MVIAYCLWLIDVASINEPLSTFLGFGDYLVSPLACFLVD